ncbi:MAG: electron transfer flavoprotein subunit alpha/FixB family protein [Actinobacteria bacterium]|nr:electron transfer flavoprotein subunit alpha/FixB family protein [Actinomycetota bacterium]
MTSRALVLAELRGGSVPPGNLGAIAAASSCVDEVDVLVVCKEGDVLDHALLGLLGGQGARTVHLAHLAPALAAVCTDVLDLLVCELNPDIVILESSSLASDAAAALAARRSAGVNWDLVGLEQDGNGSWIGTRLALQDSLVVRVGWTTQLAVAVLRPGSFEPRQRMSQPRLVRAPQPEERVHCAGRVVSSGAGEGESSGLESADIVVAGGRGVTTLQDFSLLQELANVLGGALGVSMPVVDKGWFPHSYQVGQTGRTVRPRLYIACGISGAIQHRVGMGRSGTIVVINTDPQAPLFGVCDFGIVGDLAQVIPRLTEALQHRI